MKLNRKVNKSHGRGIMRELSFREKEPNFRAVEWVAWLGATGVACVVLTSFVYSNFQTKADAKETKADVIEAIRDLKKDLKEDIKKLSNKVSDK